jgi:hypothetical protein
MRPRQRSADPDLDRCVTLLPPSVQADVRHLVDTLPPDDLMPIIRAARDGDDDDAEAVYLLGRLHERAIHRAYLVPG